MLGACVSNGIETEVVIIGSGAGGAAVAGELARNGIPTVVLEAGPASTEPLGSHVRNRDPSELGLNHYNDALKEALVFPSGGGGAGPAFNDFKVVHAVGGMFAYWTCNCPTPHQAERAPWITASEWDDILARARALLNVGYDLGEGSIRQQQIIDRVAAVIRNNEPGRDVQPMPVAARLHDGNMRFSSVENLLSGSRSNALDVRPDLVCRAILHRNGRATGVVARSRGGRDDVTVAAQVVVVAAGTVGTPKLIAGSGIDAGPALGAYIFDHPAIGSRVVLRTDILAETPEDDPVFTVWISFATNRPWHNQICRFPTNPTSLEYLAGPKISPTYSHFQQSTSGLRTDSSLILIGSTYSACPTKGDYSLSVDDYRRLAAGLQDHFRIAATIGNLIDHRWSPTFFG